MSSVHTNTDVYSYCSPGWCGQRTVTGSSISGYMSDSVVRDHDVLKTIACIWNLLFYEALQVHHVEDINETS